MQQMIYRECGWFFNGTHYNQIGCNMYVQTFEKKKKCEKVEKKSIRFQLLLQM